MRGVQRLILLVMALITQYGYANSNTLDAQIHISAFAEDNYGLRRGHNRNDVTGWEQQAQIKITSDTGINQYSGGLKIKNQDIDAVGQLEDDQFDVFAGFTRSMETSRISADARYEQDTTLSDEFITGSNNLLRSDTERYRTTLNLNYLWLPTETTYWNFTVSGEDLNYEGNPIRLFPYQYYVFVVQPNWDYSSTQSVYLSLVKSRLDYEEREVSSVIPTYVDSSSASLGWRYEFSERSSLDLSVGYRQTEYEQIFQLCFPCQTLQTFNFEGDGATYNIEYSYKGEQSRGVLRFSQASSPNSSGRVLNERKSFASYRYNTSKRLSFDGSIEYVEQSDDLESLLINDYDTLYVYLSAYWRVYRAVSVFSRYRYISREEALFEDDKTESNRLDVGLRWIFDPNYF